MVWLLDGFALFEKSSSLSFLLDIFRFIFLVVGLLFLIYTPGEYLEYCEFETEYKLQQELYNNYSYAPDTDILVVMDIFETNAQLLEYQAER